MTWQCQAQTTKKGNKRLGCADRLVASLLSDGYVYTTSLEAKSHKTLGTLSHCIVMACGWCTLWELDCDHYLGRPEMAQGCRLSTDVGATMPRAMIVGVVLILTTLACGGASHDNAGAAANGHASTHPYAVTQPYADGDCYPATYCDTDDLRGGYANHSQDRAFLAGRSR